MLRRQSKVVEVTSAVYRFRSGDVGVTPGSQVGRKASTCWQLKMSSRRAKDDDIMV
jgi:hypothetical protein